MQDLFIAGKIAMDLIDVIGDNARQQTERVWHSPIAIVAELVFKFAWRDDRHLGESSAPRARDIHHPIGIDRLARVEVVVELVRSIEVRLRDAGRIAPGVALV